MAVLPNSHIALLRNKDRLQGRLAILGLCDAGLVSELSGPGLMMTEHAGLYQLFQSQTSNLPQWTTVFGYDDTSLECSSADTAVIFLPKSRSEFSLRLALALWLVAPGGQVVVVGEKKQGVAGAVRQLIGSLPQARKIDSARHCQVWQANVTTLPKPFQLTDWLQWHRIERAGAGFEVAGLPGIFSDGELDDGTAMLLSTMADKPLMNGRVLDFACGAGVIGTWVQMAQRNEGREVWPVDGIDVQAQAVFCARATYEKAQVEGTIVASDGLGAIKGQYQSVVTNPPFHTGVQTDTSMTEQFLQEVSRHLVKGGELRLVANRFLPYEALIRQYVGKPVVLAEDRRFAVWSAWKS